MPEEIFPDPLADIDPMRVAALLSEIDTLMESVGLSMSNPIVTTVPEAPTQIIFASQFGVSRFAFSTQVLDREQAGFDQKFREIGVSEQNQTIEDLKQQYKNGDFDEM